MKQKVVAKAIIKQDDQVLLLRRYGGRPSIQGFYELPGGNVYKNQQPQDALRAGLKTHIGVDMKNAELIDVMTYVDPDDRELQYVFIIFAVDIGLPAAEITLSREYDKFIQKSLSDIQPNILTQSTQQILGLPDQAVSRQNYDLDKEVAKNTTKLHLLGFSDGGSRGNPGLAASGYVLMDDSEQVVSQGGVYLGVTTNNVAEYTGLKTAMEKALALGATTLDMKLDSELVVKQMNGLYKVKSPEMLSLNQQVHQLVAKFDKVTFTHVLREHNALADGLVNKVLDEVEAGHDVPVYGIIS